MDYDDDDEEMVELPEVTIKEPQPTKVSDEPLPTEITWDDLLAYDIETTGLSRYRDDITVVCLYGYGCGEGIVFNFLEEERYEEKKVELLALLDAAPRLASFNGVRFDAPFIQTAFQVDPARVQSWITKSFDVWEICKTLLRVTFRMEELLKLNGFECKLGSGMDAIQWAKDKNMWPKLEEYCLQDAKLTWQVSRLHVIKVPRTGHFENEKGISIVKISPASFSIVYPSQTMTRPSYQRALLVSNAREAAAREAAAVDETPRQDTPRLHGALKRTHSLPVDE